MSTIIRLLKLIAWAHRPRWDRQPEARQRFLAQIEQYKREIKP